ncbi:MAG: zinc ribbon domain-containing protein [Desulfatirhabdiaceae bacterium]
MKEQIKTLVALQKIEAERTQIQTHLQGISMHLGELNNQISEKQSLIECETEAIAEKRRTCGALEQDLKNNQALILRSQERLKSVKTNREYQALLKEIEELKNLNTKFEDDMLALLNEIETEETLISTAAEDMQNLSQTLETEKKSVQKETDSHESRLRKLDGERDRFSMQADPSLLKLFNRVRSVHNRGNAVVPAVDSICNGCNVNIPPQMYNELQRCQSVKLCPNCQRIIYWLPS